MTKTDRVVILGAPRSIIEALIAQGINAVGERELAQEDPRGQLQEIKILKAQPYRVDYNEMHPNDNWRGQGKRNKRFR